MTSDHKVARIQAKADLLLALYSHVSHDLERTRAEAELLRKELADIRRDFEIANRQLGEARNEVERVHRELNQTRNEFDQLTARSAQLQQQHDALLTSTSWRVTAPIRAVARVAKR